jgi:small subunit ribosomal protein S9
MSETKKTIKKTEVKKPAPKKKEVKEVKVIKKAKEVEEIKDIDEVEDVDRGEDKIPEFSGKFISAIGRRKTATASVRLYENGKGAIVCNGIKISKYFPGDSLAAALQPLKLTSHLRDLNFSAHLSGGGKSGQVAALRHGISRALLKFDPALKEVLAVTGMLTRDQRKVERKKPGLKKARKAPQWSKR